ncbi:hypothetical protein AAG570_005673 [Ranatra chinensis]|uniref:Uncharacterized protein n=1 Tax=Ranatra chinensis TaxID=642074 RepID=A0ABD0YAX0_9HEMI
MAFKRRNMFYQNKKWETTGIASCSGRKCFGARTPSSAEWLSVITVQLTLTKHVLPEQEAGDNGNWTVELMMLPVVFLGQKTEAAPCGHEDGREPEEYAVEHVSALGRHVPLERLWVITVQPVLLGSKRRNIFYQNKKQKTTEIVEHVSALGRHLQLERLRVIAAQLISFKDGFSSKLFSGECKDALYRVLAKGQNFGPLLGDWTKALENLGVTISGEQEVSDIISRAFANTKQLIAMEMQRSDLSYPEVA